MILGYWDIRGLGQPIRLLLAYKKVDYKDRRYFTGPAPDYDKTEWLNEKFTLGLAFPNLPYLIDGDVKLSQTHAIMRYLGRKYDLVGKTEEEKWRIDLAELQIIDLRNAWTGLCYSGFATQAETFKANLPNQLKAFSQFLGERKFFAGERITYVDFLIYEILFQLKVFSVESFAAFDKLLAYVARVEALPSIAEYIKSDKYLKWPFNNNMAQFGQRTMACPF